MILFIFEGERREPQIFKSLENLFFPNKDEHVACSFGNNIYNLYKLLSQDDGIDIVASLKEKLQNGTESRLRNFEKTSDFSEIYLFFDYDFHDNQNLSLAELNRRLREMLDFFDDETDSGKLYINYPMVESIRYTKKLPDMNFWEYCVSRDECANFKNLVHEFSYYKNLDYICKTSGMFNEAKQNWQLLKEQNVSKANYICNGKNAIPHSKKDISQQVIFESQVEKFVNQKDCCVAILNAFPIFLFDYFK